MWDRSIDNKFYYRPDTSGYALGGSYEYRMRVTPFEATAGTWQAVGKALI